MPSRTIEQLIADAEAAAEAAGVSKSELRRKAEIDVGLWSRYRRGLRQPNLPNLRRIEAAEEHFKRAAEQAQAAQ
jgi:hypothetical protein